MNSAEVNALPERVRRYIHDLIKGATMKTFEEVWAEKEREGYSYGEDALEQVRFGWELAVQAMHARGAPVAKPCEHRSRKRVLSVECRDCGVELGREP